MDSHWFLLSFRADFAGASLEGPPVTARIDTMHGLPHRRRRIRASQVRGMPHGNRAGDYREPRPALAIHEQARLREMPLRAQWRGLSADSLATLAQSLRPQSNGLPATGKARGDRVQQLSYARSYRSFGTSSDDEGPAPDLSRAVADLRDMSRGCSSRPTRTELLAMPRLC